MSQLILAMARLRPGRGWWLVCPFCAQEYKHTAVLVLVQCRPDLVLYEYKYLDMQNITM